METLNIVGALGPVQELPRKGLEIYPFTVFVGEQGTGKSLFSQLIYFFRNLPFLVRYYDVQSKPGTSEKAIVMRALDNLRSDGRRFAVFAEPSVGVRYSFPRKRELRMSLNSRNRQVYVLKSLKDEVARLRAKKGPVRQGDAIYIPSERVLYSHARGPSAWEILSLPSTLRIFGDAMEQAASTFKNWLDGKPDTVEGQWVRGQGLQALAGEAYRWGDVWKWKIGRTKQIDIDMASSGQKANWPLVLLAEALFTWRNEGLIESPFYLHIEEPEIHLHPEAQVAIVKILAYLVNHGFNVLITTHSLTVLYAVNNLLAASTLSDTVVEDGIPEPEVRLKRGDVAAYLFREDGVVESLVDKETGLLSEEHLAAVDERLGVELNRLEYLRAYGK